MDGVSLIDGVREPVFYILTKEMLNRLIEVAVAQNSPALHMSCDWLSELKRSQYGRNPSS
jgi:hypothetical protein